LNEFWYIAGEHFRQRGVGHAMLLISDWQIDRRYNTPTCIYLKRDIQKPTLLSTFGCY
jgi:hypothetical protein